MRDNRRGLFDGMVFYLHMTGKDYQGDGQMQTGVRRGILNEDGKYTYRPSDNFTHILVPPDKELKGRDRDQCSLVYLNARTFYKNHPAPLLPQEEEEEEEEDSAKSEESNLQPGNKLVSKEQAAINVDTKPKSETRTTPSLKLKPRSKPHQSMLEAGLEKIDEYYCGFDNFPTPKFDLVHAIQKDWDIPRLVESYSECLDEDDKVIKALSKPVLRFYWIRN
ncbi:uncharacterized protein I303_107505 [Kwoniella dejecticola CBS 10117]|uniref:Uncharacterized protein n=1 Tax=Kwoniella dejecticola CBS 10117 TaxID=1296121 RepID=A0A1A5ZZU8_9TREE|nr:uncharacterized protein I303_06910 [Kwoniella dejecticola CBS 10117]OBR83345.1 hypothetical protein I303_06910 [Kwoniella dejecticola CBS 10117]